MGIFFYYYWFDCCRLLSSTFVSLQHMFTASISHVLSCVVALIFLFWCSTVLWFFQSLPLLAVWQFYHRLLVSNYFIQLVLYALVAPYTEQYTDLSITPRFPSCRSCFTFRHCVILCLAQDAHNTHV